MRSKVCARLVCSGRLGCAQLARRAQFAAQPDKMGKLMQHLALRNVNILSKDPDTQTVMKRPRRTIALVLQRFEARSQGWRR